MREFYGFFWRVRSESSECRATHPDPRLSDHQERTSLIVRTDEQPQPSPSSRAASATVAVLPAPTLTCITLWAVSSRAGARRPPPPPQEIFLACRLHGLVFLSCWTLLFPTLLPLTQPAWPWCSHPGWCLFEPPFPRYGRPCARIMREGVGGGMDERRPIVLLIVDDSGPSALLRLS